MDEVSGFWAGAQDHGRGVDLEALARECHGWAALEQAGEGPLVRSGVDPHLARAWVRTPPRRTRGLAITLADPRYPVALRLTREPPPVLFVEGELDRLADPAVAVVGTRRCTAYGVAVTRHLASSLVAGGYTVVSGLARGIDTHAHRAALRWGRTIAVLGHGLDHTAPPSNRVLRRQLVDGGGLVVSCWPDAFEPRPHTFPIRNRWIAGLSQLVVVVEAGRRSGAHHTVRASLDEGRDAWAVPGPLGAEASRGCLDLVAQGAGVVVDVEEFVAEVVGAAGVRREPWLEQLFTGRTVDEVARSTGRSVAELLCELSLLEVRGEVVRLPGQRYAPGGSPG